MYSTIKLEVKPDKEKNTIWYNVLPVSKFSDSRYGDINISSDLIKKMEENFNKGIPTYEPLLNLRHNDDSGKYGRALKLEAKNDGLWVLWEFYDNGLKKIHEDHFEYMSAEYSDDYKDKKTGKNVGPVFLGAALTNRPAHPDVEKINMFEDFKQFIKDLFVKEKIKTEDDEMEKSLEERLNFLEEKTKKLEEDNKNLKAKLEESKKSEEEIKNKKFESDVDNWSKNWINKGAYPSQVNSLKKIVLESKDPEMMQKFDEVLKPAKNIFEQYGKENEENYDSEKTLEERLNSIKKMEGEK